MQSSCRYKVNNNIHSYYDMVPKQTFTVFSKRERERERELTVTYHKWQMTNHTSIPEQFSCIWRRIISSAKWVSTGVTGPAAVLVQPRVGRHTFRRPCVRGFERSRSKRVNPEQPSCSCHVISSYALKKLRPLPSEGSKRSYRNFLDVGNLCWTTHR